MEIKEIYKVITYHLLNDGIPSDFFKSNEFEEILDVYPFTMLSKQKNTPQNLKYHPEGSVWNHTLMVIDEAAKRKLESSDEEVFMWSALLHDIGKPYTTKIRKNGKITSYDHEKEGEFLAETFLKELNCKEDFIKKVKSIVRWHMEPLFVTSNLPFANINSMKKDVDPKEIALFSICDRLGRGNLTSEKREEEIQSIKKFLRKVI